MTTGVFLLSPGGMFADANARAVHSNATITANGTLVLAGFGNQELHLVVNLTVAPTGTAPTIQFTVQEIDPGNQSTPIGAPVVGPVLSAVGTDVLSLPTSTTSAVQVSWAVTGAGASFTGVFATLVSKLTSPRVEGIGAPGTPAGGVVSIQGVPGGQPLPISGTVMATNPSVSADGAPAPAFATQVGGSDGTNLQSARVHDLDSGAGSEFDLGVSIRLPGAGGSVAGGTATDPLRVDPTGTTTQPISAVSLPLPTGAATEATLATRVADATITARLNTLGQKAMAASAPVVLASDQSAVPIAGTDGATAQEVRVHDLDTGAGTEFDLGVSIRLPGAGGSVAGGTAANPLRVDPTGTTTQPVSATSLPLPTGAATEATLATRVADATVTARLNTLGQKTMAASAPVVISSDQSRLPVSSEVQLDYNTGAGTQSLSMVGIALPSGAGAVAGGTTTNPVRVDPTGTTTQPVSAASLPLPTGAATEATLATRVSDATVTARLNTLGQKVSASSAPVVIASDQSSIPVASTQLPAALVGGRLTVDVGSWIGSSGPSIGQKLSASSLPVVIASDQSAIPVSGTVTATNPSVGANAAAAPASSTQIGGTDGTNLRSARVYDLDTGVGSVYDLGVSIRLPGAGGSVAGGTGTNPLRVDPTGTTTQPISAASLPLPAGAATELTLSTRVSDATIITRLGVLGQKPMTGSAPVVIASDQSAIPVTGSITATNPSVGLINSGFPGSATQIGASDGLNLRVPRVFDADTGGGLEYVMGAVLRKSASGGSVEAGTASDPLRVDPTGTTTQPISAVSLPLPTGAAQDRITAGVPFSVRLSDGVGFYDAPRTSQLPSGLVGGRLDTNNGAWLGSTAPTVGQKVSASSLPVVISSDQSAIPITGTITATNPSVGINTDPAPLSSTQIGASDGANLQAARAFDLNTGVATEWNLGVSVRLPANGGSVAGGTSTNPFRTDPTGTTTQPVSAVSLPLPTGAATEATLATRATEATLATRVADATITARLNTLGQKTMANSAPVVIASDQSAIVVADGGGSLTVDTTQLPAALVGGRLDTNVGSWLGSTAPTVGQKAMVASLPVVVASNQSAIPVSGTVTANQGTAAALAGGWPVQITDGSDVLGTATDPIRVDPTGTTAQPVTDNGGSLTVDGAVTANIGTTNGLALDATLTGGTQKAIVRGGAKGATAAADVTSTAEGADHQALDVQIYHGGAAVNPTQIRALTAADVVSVEVNDWLGSTAPTVGQKTSANSLPVVIASDQSAIPVTGTFDNNSVGPTNAAVPAEATQIGGSDGTNLQALRVFDADSGAGSQFVLGTILRKAASGGSVEAGTASDPLRVDPTGTTTQPVSDAGGSLTVDTTQLPAALVGGRLDTNVGTWLGSTAPTVGQKTSANSLPVVISSDQSAIPITGSITATNPSVGPTGDPVPAEATQIGGSDGTDLQSVRVFDADTGVGTQYVLGVSLRKSASGGSVEAGTSADPLRFDPTGTTAQPITDNGGSLTVDTPQLPGALVGGRLDTNVGAWLGSTAPTVGQKTSANSLPVVLASDQSDVPISGTVTADQGAAAALADGWPVLITDGTDVLGTATDPIRVDPTGTTAQPVTDNGGSLTVDGTVTANIGTTNGLALDATLTGGTQKAIVRGGAKGATVAADVTSTAEGADHQALDIQVYHGGVAVNPTQIRALTNTDVVSVEVNDWLGSTAPTVGQKTMANSLPVVIASDQTAIPITGSITATNPSVGPTDDPVPLEATQIGGSDGTNLQTLRVFDVDSGAGSEFVAGVSLRKSASGGSVEAGTSSDPLRVDPTGTTTQPVSDAGGSLTVDTTQLPAALVGGRLDANVGAWLGSTAPTVGQKASANSLPVVIASDQSDLPVSGTVTADQGAAAALADGWPVLITDGTDVLGTATDPIRVDPTGTTAQPVTDNGGSLTVDGTVTANIGTTNGLALDATLTSGAQKAIVRGGAKGVTVAADVTSTAEGADHQALDVQIYHGGAAINPTQIRALTAADVVSVEVNDWLGSTAPTVGQKTSANSLPVVIASDQSPIPITGSITATNPSVGPTEDPVPAEATQIGGSDGTDLQAIRVFDADTGAGTEYVVGVSLRKSASGGSVEAGTSTDPIRIDPTGTTTQPVSDAGGSLTVDTTQLPAALVGGRLDSNVGAWLGSTAPTVGQKASANSLPVVIASDQSDLPVSGTVTADQGAAAALADGWPVLITDGTDVLGTATDPIRVDPTGTTAQPVTDNGGSLTVDGTITANIGTTNGLALDATLTGGTQKAIVRGGAKGATAAADVTSTAEGADHQALDVQLYHGGAAINPTQIRALTAADVVSAEVTEWLGSAAPTVGQKTMADSLPVVIASDQSAIPVTGTFDNNSVGPTNAAVPAEATQIGGSDGTNLQTLRVFDVDTGAGAQYVVGVSLRKAASGGSVEAGTSADPIRIDPTGTTAQPVTDNGGSLTVDTTQLPAALVGGRLDANVGAWLGSTAPTVGQKTSANSIPTVLASDQSAIPVSDGGGSLTVDGTVTANIGTTGGLALDATLTGGTAKAIVRGGAKGATAAADVTSTAEGADHQALDVQLYHGGAAIDPTQIRALTSADVVTAAQGTAAALSGYWPVRVTDGTNTMPTADTAARSSFHRVTDGTNTAAVKAASTAAVATDPALVVAISPNTAPIVQTVGTHANAWNAAVTGANGISSVVDCQYTPFITVFGNSSGNTNIQIQVSQDNTNFYTVQTIAATNNDFGTNLTVGARYLRLLSVTSRTVTATIAGKSG